MSPAASRAKQPTLSAQPFRSALSTWFKANARELPWRGDHEPYHIWVSEIMLQQTRVAAVIAHYTAFLLQFPTLVSLALAPEQDVLAAWSGLGYYRRARMLHKAAQFVVREHDGILPTTAAELRKLPGIGDYTAAAIASIAFGEGVALMDGNVERVLLRVLGLAEEKGKTVRTELLRQATALLTAKGKRPSPGDHNQAMMELGAMVCLPRNPLCDQCPVLRFCLTRGEHAAPARPKMRSQQVAYMLATRKRGTSTEVLLRQRLSNDSLMPGMWELPEVPLESVTGEPELLSVRHSITNTNYYVRIFAARTDGSSKPVARIAGTIWTRTATLNSLALTGLARKVLRRLELMIVPMPALPKSSVENMEESTL